MVVVSILKQNAFTVEHVETNALAKKSVKQVCVAVPTAHRSVQAIALIWQPVLTTAVHVEKSVLQHKNANKESVYKTAIQVQRHVDRHVVQIHPTLHAATTCVQPSKTTIHIVEKAARNAHLVTHVAMESAWIQLWIQTTAQAVETNAPMATSAVEVAASIIHEIKTIVEGVEEDVRSAAKARNAVEYWD